MASIKRVTAWVGRWPGIAHVRRLAGRFVAPGTGVDAARIAAIERRLDEVEIGLRLALPRLDDVEIGLRLALPRLDRVELGWKAIQNQLEALEPQLLTQYSELPALRNAMESAHQTARLLRRELAALTDASRA